MSAMDFNDPVPETGDTDSTAASRKRSRDSLFLMANIRTAEEREPVAVRVRNLSEGGLMVELGQPIDIETLVEVEVRGIGWVKGRVAWQAEGRTGIAFDKPIDPQRARKPVGAGGKTPVFVKPLITRR